jgi:hypothetical protein
MIGVFFAHNGLDLRLRQRIKNRAECTLNPSIYQPHKLAFFAQTSDLNWDMLSLSAYDTALNGRLVKLTYGEGFPGKTMNLKARPESRYWAASASTSALEIPE